MREKPKLSCTRNYDVFEMHEFNRPLHEDPRLLASMQKVGFMPSSPIQCARNGNGRLKVLRGHHRLDYAKRLGLPVWYVVDDSKVDIFDLEGGRQQWNAGDFAAARASSGNGDISKVLDFKKLHHLTLGSAASLMGGQSAGSSNHVKTIKDGTFRVAKDLSHAHAVVDITDWARACGITFATSAAFVAAISMCLRVPEFDASVFKHRIRLNGAQLMKRGTVREYLQEIEALYNYAAKASRLNVAFRADEVARARKASFGKSNTLKPKANGKSNKAH